MPAAFARRLTDTAAAESGRRILPPLCVRENEYGRKKNNKLFADVQMELGASLGNQIY